MTFSVTLASCGLPGAMPAAKVDDGNVGAKVNVGGCTCVHMCTCVCVCVCVRVVHVCVCKTHTVAWIFGDEHVYPKSVAEPVSGFIQHPEILACEVKRNIRDSMRATHALEARAHGQSVKGKIKYDTVRMAVYY